MDLADLFPDADFRFHFTLRRGEPNAFFRDRDASGAVREERRRWIAQDPERYTALRPGGLPLFEELRELAPAWGLSAFADVRDLGSACESDVLLLARGTDDRFRLQGGALVFPSHWDLADKLGRTVGEMHAIVPGLNGALGATIDRFLATITSGLAYHRSNWGLTANRELNDHPTRGLPGPAAPVALDRLWLRIEHQALIALPRSGGLVFGIRVELRRLDEIATVDGAGARLGRALASMPPELARYKRIDDIHRPLAALLAGGTPFTQT